MIRVKNNDELIIIIKYNKYKTTNNKENFPASYCEVPNHRRRPMLHT
jgi:hypothetical protein